MKTVVVKEIQEGSSCQWIPGYFGNSGAISSQMELKYNTVHSETKRVPQNWTWVRNPKVEVETTGYDFTGVTQFIHSITTIYYFWGPPKDSFKKNNKPYQPPRLGTPH